MEIDLELFRCVSVGLCSLEQADFIQSKLEKKLSQIYQIDEFIGKSLSKSLVNYDDNEDESFEEENADKQSSNTNDHKHLEENHSTIPTKDTHLPSSSSKSNLSPGEIKPVSPSSLSEVSPVSN